VTVIPGIINASATSAFLCPSNWHETCVIASAKRRSEKIMRTQNSSATPGGFALNSANVGGIAYAPEFRNQSGN
jgi:hypothetical protein